MTLPEYILSDSGTQFASKKWKNKLADMNIDVMFSPIRYAQANPSEKCVREIGKFCRIYCNEAHKRWSELLPHIEGWLNGTLSDLTIYSPVALIFDSSRPDLFEEFLIKGLDRNHRQRACKKKC